MTIQGSQGAERLQVADLYGDAPAHRRHPGLSFVPGLAVVGVTTMAAAFLAQRYAVPLSLMSLLLGLAVNFLNEDRRLLPGLSLVTGPLLRAAIVLLGAQITLGQIASVGWQALGALAVIVLLTICSALLASRALGIDARFGMLAGGAVAICGASAAVALAAVLGRDRDLKGQLALVLVGISAMSAAAMVFYPAIAHALGMTDRQAGFLMGGAIHDVAQSVSAGYSFSRDAGDMAAIVKIGRVAMLAPVLLLAAYAFTRSREDVPSPVAMPWFIVGFFALAAINSAGGVPPLAGEMARYGVIALVSCAVAATGIQAPLRSLRELGARSLLVIGIATAMIFAATIAVSHSGIVQR